MCKGFSKVLATMMVILMLFSTSGSMTVKAVEVPKIEMVEIENQESVEVSDLETASNDDECRLNEQIKIEELEVESFPMTMSESTVLAGTISEYLTATGDAKIYNISLPAGIYLQAQLTGPANESLDYDLYLLDAEGNILTGSEYYTNLNGTSGTLPEALGYITSGDTATYYLYVHSSEGGSISEAFTLDYSISTACDSWEIDESAKNALAFTFGAAGAYVESRNLSSPIDNDWYVITVPESRIYNKLNITATTESVNECSVEVYQNISSSGYQMKRVGSGNTVSVVTGTYYIRISNVNKMEEYDDMDIQNYKLTITPILTANAITITGLEGSEGLNRYVTYPGYGTYFRTQGQSTLKIYGVATVKDPATGVTYAVAGQQVNGLYYSPAWDNNNTPTNATRIGYAFTDSEGKFEISISLPSAIGNNMYDVGISYHYFDICGVQVSLNENSNVTDSEPIFHLAHTIYHRS
nr:hypothetical protein [uncultured Cellulosilyticum sp.]